MTESALARLLTVCLDRRTLPALMTLAKYLEICQALCVGFLHSWSKVRIAGFEPATSHSPSGCSAKLSHILMWAADDQPAARRLS